MIDRSDSVSFRKKVELDVKGRMWQQHGHSPTIVQITDFLMDEVISLSMTLRDAGETIKALSEAVDEIEARVLKLSGQLH